MVDIEGEKLECQGFEAVEAEASTSKLGLVGDYDSCIHMLYEGMWHSVLGVQRGASCILGT